MKPEIQKLCGPWDWSYALDEHTVSSALLPTGEFDTTRTEIGEALYRLKYCGDRGQVQPLARELADFLSGWVDCLRWEVMIPVPPSLERRFQPVYEIADAAGKQLGLRVDFDYLQKVRTTQAVKQLEDVSSRAHELAGAFTVADLRYSGKRVLLFDDIFRSGETVREITKTLQSQGQVQLVDVVTLTKTRVKR